ncbi:MAG: hypothetical protein V1705_00065 [bacterium]
MNRRKSCEKTFSRLKSLEPPVGLFDRIILAIKREQDLRQTKKLAFGFLVLLAISLFAAPFSWRMLSVQTAESGVLYFTSVAWGNFGAFLSLWPDSLLAVAESLPITGITLFTVNMIASVFTLRLFLHRKRLLISYFTRGRLTPSII